MNDVLKPLGRQGQSSSQGPAPMEVDAAAKGKGGDTGKGKQKGKQKGSWFNQWTNFSGWGKGKSYKGKSKGKGKSKSKGKSKGKQSKGKGKQKGKLSSDRCRVCGGTGHWGNECPQRQDARQVESRNDGNQSQVGSSVADTRVPSSAATTYSNTTGQTRSVRRVHLYHVGTPPCQTPERYAISEASSNDDWSAWSSQVRTVIASELGEHSEVELFCMCDAEDMQCGMSADQMTDDPFYCWLRSNQEPQPQVDRDALHVRAVGEIEEEWIVLDSGADVSLIPHRCMVGRDVETPNLYLQDAQGKELRIGGMKQAEVEFTHLLAGESSCCLSESFVVSDVTSILLSFGRLLKTGWKFGGVRPEDHSMLDYMNRGPCAGILTSPDSVFRVPVFYRKNSLSVLAHVRNVTSGTTGHVRTVYVKMKMDVETLKAGWSFLTNGEPVHKGVSKQFANPGDMLSVTTWKYRTTIVLVGGVREVVEHSKDISGVSDLTADIPGILYATTVLTFLQRRVTPLSDCFCEPLSDSQLVDVMDEIEAAAKFEEQKEMGTNLFAPEADVPIELRNVPNLEPNNSAGGHEEQLETVWVNGKELSVSSRVEDLQDACNFLGLNASGSKKKLYDRLCAYVSRQYQKDIDLSRMNLQKEMLGPQAQLQTGAEQPPEDPLDVERHMATHLPFAKWCDVCVVRTKSREDKSLSSSEASVEDSGVPHIQMDWMYLGRNCPALVLIDSWSRYGAIFPSKSKGAWRSLAEFAVRFSLELNHLTDVVFVMDSEPATLGLLDMIVMIRQEMGYKASKKMGKPYHKGRTAKVERFIQTLKRQAATLTVNVEGHIHEQLDEVHCLKAWALVHSVFLLNRFHEHSAIKATPYETVFGKKYMGKLLPFGEFVFGLRQPARQKGTSVWVGGIWVGKDQADMNILLTVGGQFTTRSVRRCAYSWRRDVVQSLTLSPWSKSKTERPVSMLEAPLATIEEQHPDAKKREPHLLASGGIDEEAELVRDAADEYSPTQASAPSEAPIEEQPFPRQVEDLEPLTEEQRRSLLDLPIQPNTPRDDEMRENKPPEKRSGEGVPDSERKAARLDREGSPSSSGLYSPFFAGNVEEISMTPHNDERWETEVDWEMIYEGLDEVDEINFHGEQPPDLPPEDLQQLDGEAMKEEVSKLKSIGVVHTISYDERDPEGKFVDLREVFDWRYRDGRWKRRCRIVARDFKTTPSNEDTFSPTSAFGVVRFFLMCHLFFGWKVTSLHISDAYLTVPQVEKCYVEIRPGIKELLGLSPDSLWELKRVLPG